MHVQTIDHYARQADKRERDPIVTPGEHGRADVANGPMSKWLRFNRADELVYMDTPTGRRAMTRKTADVFDLIRTYANTGIRVSLHKVAEELHVAASTVYRACVKLAAWGLIAYQSNRGRHGGYMVRMREAKDGLEWAQEAAKAMIRKWYRASEDRISRLRSNVASCFPGREQELYQYRSSSSNSTERNIRIDYPEWTPQDFREAGLM